MGNNLYTKWVDGTTTFSVASMDTPLGELDKAIGYRHNPIFHTDGVVEYDILTGKLSWSSTIRIYFTTAAGDIVSNTIAAGSVTLTDNQFAYADLNETDTTVISVTAASITLAASSNTIAVARVVLGYRNTASDQYFPVMLPLFDGTLHGAIQTTDATVTTLASLTLSEGKAYQVEARVTAREGDITWVNTYIRRALVYRQTAGSASQQGSTIDVYTEEGNAAWNVTIDTNSNDVRLRITGEAATTIEWRGVMRLVQV